MQQSCSFFLDGNLIELTVMVTVSEWTVGTGVYIYQHRTSTRASRWSCPSYWQTFWHNQTVLLSCCTLWRVWWTGSLWPVKSQKRNRSSWCGIKINTNVMLNLVSSNVSTLASRSMLAVYMLRCWMQITHWGINCCTEVKHFNSRKNT